MRTRRGIKGMTLVELTVVLAVIAIVATLVISFSLIISARQSESSQRLAAITELELTVSMTVSFIDENPDCYVKTGEGSALCTDSTRLTLSDGKLGVFGNDGSLIKTLATLERITKISFKTLGDTDSLYICEVYYTVGNTTEVYSFSVDSFIGEAVAS